MAMVYRAQGKHELALKYHTKDLRITQKVLREDHPSTATTYHNMANVYDDQGKHELALELFAKALRIYQKMLGEDHPLTQLSGRNIKRVKNRLA